MSELKVPDGETQIRYFCFGCNTWTLVRCFENDIWCISCFSRRIEVVKDTDGNGFHHSEKPTPKEKLPDILHHTGCHNYDNNDDNDSGIKPNSNRNGNQNSGYIPTQPITISNTNSSISTRLRRYLSWSPQSSSSDEAEPETSSNGSGNQTTEDISTNDYDENSRICSTVVSAVVPGRSSGNVGTQFDPGSESFDDLYTDVNMSTKYAFIPPLSAESMSKLKRIRFTKDYLSSAKGKQVQKCNMCKDDIVALEILIQLNCSHVFHEHCLLTWLKISGCCPDCRKDLTKENAGGWLSKIFQRN